MSLDRSARPARRLFTGATLNWSPAELIDIFVDTKRTFDHVLEHFGPMSPKSRKICIFAPLPMVATRQIYDPPIVEVRNADSFNVAVNHAEMGLAPLVLNMANPREPGGGVMRGATAQEEELWRRSNAYFSHPASMYPIADDEAIVADEVAIIKYSRAACYHNMEHPVVVGMYTCAAIYAPRLLPSGAYTAFDERLMRAKIESIFVAGIAGGFTSLVLGAFGCGVFANPPEAVAALFRAAVDKYGKYFRCITFAVLVVNQRDERNLAAFQREFGGI